MVLLLDNEVRRSVQVRICGVLGRESSSWIIWVDALVLQSVRVLADVIKELATFMVILGPLSHIVRGFLLLEPLEDDLVLTCDLHELTFASLAVQAFLVCE